NICCFNFSFCFFYFSFLQEILAKSKNPLYDTLKMNNYKNSNEISKMKSWRSIVNSMYIQTVSLFKVPHIMKSLNVFILIACITASYYTLMLWFPELFQRFAKYEKMYPENSASVCKISKINLHDNNKTLAIICTFLSTIVTIGFFFIRSSTQNLILSSIFEALTSLCMSITLCIIVDIFPTNLRMMAASLGSFCARVGAFAGNWIFGYLIDHYCLFLIVLVATQLFFCTILSCLIPGRFGEIKPRKIP
ncbi:hypothetical protein M0802_016104, partial [Mischocyttarus mexicanus]